MCTYKTVRLAAFLAVVFLFPFTTHAQTAQTFQNFFFEGSQQDALYGDAGFIFSDFEGANSFDIGAQVGFPIGTSFELGVMLDYLSIDPEFGDNISGLIDPVVLGRYQVQEGETDISVGGGLSLPIGEEDIGQGDVDVYLFGALRYLVNAELAISGVVGIDFYERGDDRDASLRFGVAGIYRVSPEAQLVTELSILSEVDYALLSFGLDYEISGGTRLRPAIGLGLDDGAPDLLIAARILFQQ